ncbi:MAG: hypothetical protein Q9162_007802 [Coniocarpon cinnabarinum]
MIEPSTTATTMNVSEEAEPTPNVQRGRPVEVHHVMTDDEWEEDCQPLQFSEDAMDYAGSTNERTGEAAAAIVHDCEPHSLRSSPTLKASSPIQQPAAPANIAETTQKRQCEAFMAPLLTPTTTTDPAYEDSDLFSRFQRKLKILLRSNERLNEQLDSVPEYIHQRYVFVRAEDEASLDVLVEVFENLEERLNRSLKPWSLFLQNTPTRSGPSTAR